LMHGKLGVRSSVLCVIRATTMESTIEALLCDVKL
jgi:hypothetical protein